MAAHVQQTADSLIILNFAGDVTLADYFQWHVKRRYDYAFKRLQSFSAAHISMVNLENPISRSGIARDKPYVFRALPEYVKVLVSGGVDIVSLANNHIYDYGERGLFDTIKYLDAAGIRHVGAGRNLEQARKEVIFSIMGKRLAFLAYYGLRPHSGSHPATKDSAGTALRNLRYIRRDIRRLRKTVDYIVINFHWGIESEHYPREDQIYFAHKTIDYGADLIIGHHPHVWQGIEKYHGGIIAYSLGNFIFGGNSRKHATSAFLTVSLNPKQNMKAGISIVPVQVDLWQPSILSGPGGKAFIDRIKTYSSVFADSIF